MHSEFYTYLQLGFSHISDLRGYDHILFLIALCAVYRLREWRQVAILVTAFTVGHSLTLALAALDRVSVPSSLIEFLIPLTIFLTALYNIFRQRQRARSAGAAASSNIHWNYLLALIFGLIHGLGFSNFFGALLLPGEEDHLIRQLLAFNIGVELGQLAIVLVILLISYLVMEVFGLAQRYWLWAVSLLAAIPAVVMMVERWPV